MSKPIRTFSGKSIPQMFLDGTLKVITRRKD